MRRILSLTILLCTLLTAATAQRAADKIVGIYHITHKGEESRIRIVKNVDDTYTAQVISVKNRTDKNGKVRLDEKNPDKSLRNTPCDRIVLIKGMKYDATKNTWGNAKIYDPTRGLRANVTCSFDTATRLRVRGSVLGIGETVYWDKESEQK